MKKLLSLAIVLLLVSMAFSSCSMSKEEKARKLSEEKIKETLADPESFDMVTFEMDSAYAPFDDPQFYELTIQLLNSKQMLDAAKEDKNNAELEYALFNDHSIYASEFEKAQRRQAKEKLDKIRNTLVSLNSRDSTIVSKIRMSLSAGRKFIGYKTRVTYRATDNYANNINGGKTSRNPDHVLSGISEAVILTDKDLTKAIAFFDCGSDEYQAYKQFKDILQDSINSIHNMIKASRPTYSKIKWEQVE